MQGQLTSVWGGEQGDDISWRVEASQWLKMWVSTNSIRPLDERDNDRTRSLEQIWGLNLLLMES